MNTRLQFLVGVGGAAAASALPARARAVGGNTMLVDGATLPAGPELTTS